MIRKINSLSIKAKLITVITGITVTALIIANIAQMSFDYFTLRNDLKQEFHKEAELTGKSLTSALDFIDYKTASEILNGFTYNESIKLACLYDGSGKIFSYYSPKNSTCPPADEISLKQDNFEILRTHYNIFSQEAQVGSLYLEKSLNVYHKYFLKKVATVILIIAITSLLTYLLAGILQRPISTPIIALSQHAINVARNGDYSVHIERTTDDETGELVTAFNDMIKTVRDNENKLLEKTTDLAAALQETEDAKEIAYEQFEGLFENEMTEIFIFDAATFKFTIVNKTAQKNIGYTMEELRNMTPYDIKLDFSEEKFKQAIIPLLSGEIKLMSFGTKHERKDGTLYDADVRLQLYSYNGRTVFLSIIRDITEQKEAEEKLILAKQKSDEANRLKGEFLANMSHEIRTPINGIMGMTELLLETKLTNQQHNYARTVMNSADALLSIVNDILDFSKIESGKLELEPIAFDLMTTVEDVSELLAVKARDKSIELIMRYVPGTPQHLIGDPGRIRQIITNLAGNAIKFTEKGYVCITLESANNEQTPHGMQQIKVSVTDTGIGIPKEAHTRIFEKFSQADASTTRKFGGTGLGLSISKELVRMMNGDITVESEQGKGSTFSFTMVLKNDTEEHRPITQENTLKGVRVLVVDDININGLLVKEYLEPLGAECVIEKHSSQALKILVAAADEEKPFDIAIIDYLMPHINGDVIARTVKSNPKIKHTTMVILTSSGGAGYTRFFKEVGFNAYITKPIKKNEFIEMISVVLNNAASGKSDTFITVDDLLSRRAASLPFRNLTFKNPHILLAEDNRVNQGLAIEMLEAAGCKVSVVTNGKQAINRIKSENFDLVFMDCEMPEMNGLEASSIITEEFKNKGIDGVPIVALTGNAMQGDKERCLEAGMKDYLTKPIRKNQFMRMIAKWLPDFVNDPLDLKKMRFDGYKLLLVEDNRINAAMAEEMLKELGFEVVIAGNGEAGVKTLQQRKFDMVLMDCMMPVMDGFEATREIRKLEAEKKLTRTPIIALTANAMKGDQEACLAAGMNDYVTKPVKKSTLQEAMSRFLKPNMLEDSSEEHTVINGFDRQLLNDYKEVMGSKFTESIAHFIEDTENMLAKANEAYNACKLKELAIIAHTLKSTGAAVGAVDLSDTALNIEEEAKKRLANGESNLNIPEHLLKRLDISFNSAKTQLLKKAA